MFGLYIVSETGFTKPLSATHYYKTLVNVTSIIVLHVVSDV